MISEHDTVFYDSFTNTDSTPITSHVPEVYAGAGSSTPWVNIDGSHSGGIGNVIITGNQAVGSGSGHNLAFAANVKDAKVTQYMLNYSAPYTVFSSALIILRSGVLADGDALPENALVLEIGEFTPGIVLSKINASGAAVVAPGAPPAVLLSNALYSAPKVFTVENDGIGVRAYFSDEPTNVYAFDWADLTFTDPGNEAIGIIDWQGSQFDNYLRLNGIRVQR